MKTTPKIEHIEQWTKEQYIQWKQTRPEDAADWKIKDCKLADSCIEAHTLQNLEEKIKYIQDVKTRQFIYDMVNFHFGSVEVDEFLQHLNCYPDWI